jgi:hypothetical protein
MHPGDREDEREPEREARVTRKEEQAARRCVPGQQVGGARHEHGDDDADRQERRRHAEDHGHERELRRDRVALADGERHVDGDREARDAHHRGQRVDGCERSAGEHDQRGDRGEDARAVQRLGDALAPLDVRAPAGRRLGHALLLGDVRVQRHAPEVIGCATACGRTRRTTASSTAGARAPGRSRTR